MKIKNLLSILFLSSFMVYSGQSVSVTDFSKIFTDGEADVKIEKDATVTDKHVFKIHITLAEAKKNNLPTSFNDLADAAEIKDKDFTSLKSAFTTAVALKDSKAQKAFTGAESIGTYNADYFKSAKKVSALKIEAIYEFAKGEDTTTNDTTDATTDGTTTKEEVVLEAMPATIFTKAMATLAVNEGAAVEGSTTGEFNYTLVITIPDTTPAEDLPKYIPATLTEEHKTAYKDALEAILKSDAVDSANKTAYTSKISSAFDKAKVGDITRTSDKVITVNYVGTKTAS